ncbi:histidine kinase [Natronococcus pandeyae]|uniref:Histidine kinase n=1 Tax=Natronococcus pandeyae TaxID=2055836 RepID=A0A8J8Q7S2_9EURY|nr:PAS domain S-box protein [Natronococcus pandeyae]TYL38865.1 histidine kinase [Natronococcus pandeyae]
MNSGLEVPGTTPVRVLVVGSPSWTRTVTTVLEDRDGTVTVEESADELEDRPESMDCVLTDDREVCASVGAYCPVVCAVDDAMDTDVDVLIADGAADVVEKTASERPALLEHRIRQAIRSSSTRPAIEQHEAWYQSMIGHSSDLLVVFDTSGRVTDVSPAAERITGLETNEFDVEHAFDAVHPEDRDAVVRSFDNVCTDPPGASRTVTYRCRSDDESWRVHEVVLTNCLDDPIVGGVVGSIHDVTRYHRVENELRESLDRVTDAFYALDTEWRFTYVNSRAETLLGYSREELLGEDVREMFPHGFRSELFDRFEQAIERQESVSWERYSKSLDIWMEIHAYPSETGLSVYFRDITERIEQKQELAEQTEQLQVLVENAPVIHYVIDDEGTITLSEGRGLENIGFESSESTGESFFTVFEEYPEICADARTSLDGTAVHSQRQVLDRVFESWYQPIMDEGEVDRVIGVAVDVTERVQYQDALNTLHEATTHLLTVDSKRDAAEYIVDVADDVLDLDGIVYGFDERHNELIPSAYSSVLESEIGPPPRLGPDSNVAWESFVTRSPSTFDDVSEFELCQIEGATVRSGLCVPLGEHGVLVATSTAERQYDEDTLELAKLFAATAEAALDRIGQTQRLHDSERELKRQNRHLERLNRANEVRQKIEEHLLLSDSREAIEQGICNRLADMDACSFAWIGEPDPSGSQIRPRVHAGLERGYLDAVAMTTVDDSAAEPTGRAVRSRRPIHVENVATSVHDGTWRTDALSRSFQSVYTVPLVYDDYLYGVLSIYGDDRNAFCETFRSMLADLGETIAYTIDAVKRKNALLDAGVTEIELELTTDSALCRFADSLEARVSFEGATLQADGSALVFVAVEPPVADSGIDASLEGIDDIVVIAETETQTLLQFRLTGPFLGKIVNDHGGTLREFVSEAGQNRAIVDVPNGVEIREVLSDINRRGLSASMVARREQASSGVSALDAPARNAMLDRLTTRQQEVLRTAYHGGFFEWPRQTTGEEIAASLNISPPAFHKHIRAVEQKIFRALLERITTDG